MNDGVGLVGRSRAGNMRNSKVAGFPNNHFTSSFTMVV